MQKATIISLIMFLLFPVYAHAHLVAKPAKRTPEAIYKSQTENLKHTRYVCQHGENRNQRWHCKAKIWLFGEWKETHAKLNPVLDIESYVKRNHPCLAKIIDGENRAYDPTLDYGGGHGNVYEAYGIPQANPGYKMSSAGKDWRTNPFTQLRWMIGYVISRYGGECQAWAHKAAYGWY